MTAAERRSKPDTGLVHIVGAGLAGLSSAVHAVRLGGRVRVYEGAAHAGGRCRSFHDAHLDRRIDNGNHLLLSGNRAAMDYLRLIGADNPLTGPETARFPFLDVPTGRRWTVAPSAGLIPWWVFRAATRIPDTRPGDYLEALKLALCRRDATMSRVVRKGTPLYHRFWEPLTLGVLNTHPDEAAAHLLWPVLVETFGKGAAACRPVHAREGLSEAFVDPALAWLAARDCPVTFGRRLKEVERDAPGGRVTALVFGDGERIAVAAEDRVILALPAAGVGGLLSELTVPADFRTIINAHFRLDHLPGSEVDWLPGPLGLIGGTAEWLFMRGDVASVTISAADALAALETGTLAARIWSDVALALGLPAETEVPPVRVIKEKRATFAQTPAQVKRRAGPKTPWANLVLAGDWTDTGLPVTIEGTLRSGEKAAQIVCGAT